MPYTASEDCFVQYTIICKGTTVSDNGDFWTVGCSVMKNRQEIDSESQAYFDGDYRGREMLRLVGVAEVKAGDVLTLTYSVHGGNCELSWTSAANKFILAD